MNSNGLLTKGFLCPLPKWYNIDEMNPRFAGEYAPTCFAEFETKEERRQHYREAHNDYFKDDFTGFHFDDDYVFEPQLLGKHVLTGPTGTIDSLDPQPSLPFAEGPKKDSGASEKQLAFITTLAETKGVEANEVKTKKEASAEIDRLTALPDKGVRHNTYAGNCSDCGGVVPAGEGFIRKDSDSGRWITGHLGGCPKENNPPPSVADGYYAVTSDEGHTSFYSVKNGKKPGIIFMDLLTGGGPNATFKRQGVSYKIRDTILAKIAVDPKGAAERFGKESGRCFSCNRGLTDEESRLRGQGPDCYAKYG
jgi:Family of unknown function (DUF6011)